MITELSIRNFAIIDDISITFHDGLTVLTGETGAGKSIIIDAVELLTGSRSSVDFVRHGEKKAEITGLFTMEKEHYKIKKLCETYGIDIEDQMLILERTITNQGKSVCRINGKMVTLTILREFGQSIVNIHSQHDTIQLMDRKTHLPLLDLYNEKEIAPIKEQYNEWYKKLTVLTEKYKQLSENEQEMAHRLDLLQFQLAELEEANLSENEDIHLTEERNKLANYEKVYRTVQEAYYVLYGDQKALELMDMAKSALQEGEKYDPFIQEKAEEVSNLFFNLEEVSFSLRQFIDTLHFDEDRLNEVEARLNEINRLKKKYGSTVMEMIDFQNRIKTEIEEIQHKDSHLEKMEQDIQYIKDEALKVANKLHKIRKGTAQQLEKDIKVELNDLYLQHATFAVQFEEHHKQLLHANGIDQVTFMLATNLGEPLKELYKIASGGELSRIMLALKKIFAKHDQILTVIFDEIDTGVSGRVAQAIAEKMYQISQTTQVLCITHLPQVAAMSDHHLLISKQALNNRTSTLITDLSKDEKVKEIGRMMTGTKLTETAIEHSEQLLALTHTFKKSM
ncbi:DNA repair protein RecN [Pseudogracilibacillus auburnensis]|uniref:DNA repair protein RecN n=1 Tax=Pseudogracilibacillus auburnensis TaxID=1494959 RepID=UPI001A972B28|nr:DNA repair protein RecN [Pseudogracilibacillus auburnensis]MBO1004307.1 DNA repair protein RecN [Pseudogracilibacillus auburnensis]